ncbi:MAG TPA: beta-galactosidase [Candidatus Acidoferrales bacterium]|nr:beta-galactosidase [Candidatus Acidoferrales bacterium]
MNGQGVRLGVAYYPEQWPRSRWRTDARLMAEAGLSIARLGEFAWAALEPEPGRFELGWLEEAVGELHEAGLEVVLGTPTAAPPAWLVDAHPEILPVDLDGRRLSFGHRRHYCPNQPAYHAATQRVVDELGRRFGGDPRVIGWQIDNEFGGRCYCDACHRGFQDWLRERYRSLDELNASWGTVFWSQTYSRWEQIPLPQREPREPNPGLALDYRRFMSDSYVRYQALQAGQLREHSQGQFLTHNLMGFGFGEIDYRSLARELDVVGWDNYPSLHRADGSFTAALAADAMRGLKRKPIWVLEQQAGPIGWRFLESPAPGQVRLWTYQAIAHGAEAVLFFRWRTARFGTEQHWHGILDADGSAGKRYRDLCRLSSELQALGRQMDSATPLAEVALLHDYDSRFALQVQPTNGALAYEATVQRHYEALRRLGLGVDVLPETSGLHGYPMVVAPNLYVAGPELAAALTDYVKRGGTLVLAPRTAVKDRHNAVPERPLPAWLDELCGVRVVDYQSLSPERGVGVAGEAEAAVGGEFKGWYEELELAGAEAIARYSDGHYAGSPAITEHRVGSGRIVYLAGAATPPTLDSLYRHLAAWLKLTVMQLPEGLEAVRLQSGKDGQLLFLLNHSNGKLQLSFQDAGWHDHLSGAGGGDVFELGPYGVALLEDARLASPDR